MRHTRSEHMDGAVFSLNIGIHAKRVYTSCKPIVWDPMSHAVQVPA